jgi:hypothetical protein
VARAPLAFALLPLLAATLCAEEPCKDKEKDKPVRITLVVVLASTDSKEIDDKLTELAKEVQKRYPEFTGFKLGGTHQQSIAAGSSHDFTVTDKQTVTVAVDKPKDKAGRVGLTVTPPGGGDAVSYTCACDKFFPMVTSYKTKAGERLLLAVGGKPCTGAGP